MPSPELLDERFDEIVRELRSARVAPSVELRERVRKMAEGAPEPPLRLRLGGIRLRRAMLVLAPAAVVVALGSALVVGLATSGSSSRKAAPLTPTVVFGAAHASPALPADAAQPTGGAAVGSGALPAQQGRFQNYQAELTLRVKDLSRATKAALRLTRSFGGYVRSVDYGTGGGGGTADLVLRIPIGSVQEAIVRFSALGTILAQHVSVQDVQPQFDARFKQMQALRKRIAVLQKAGKTPQAEKLQAELAALEREQAQAARRAGFATVALALRVPRPAAAVLHRPGRLDRAADRAGKILLEEAVVLLYAGIVAGPLLLLGALALYGGRFARRRANERLLASSWGRPRSSAS